jgi:hypothetical protein
MNSLKSYRILSLCLLISAMVTGSTSAFSQTHSSGLKKELYAIENKTFSGFEVTGDAQKEMTGLINRALQAYDKQPNQDVYNTIVANFRRLTDTITTYKDGEGRRPLMILLIGYHTSKPPRISSYSIKSALKKLCPLFPFC